MRRIAPLLLTLSLLAPASALAADPPTLSVVGTGTAQLAPDVASVTVSFTRRLKDAVAARDSVNKRSARLIASATALGIDRQEIRTSQIALSRSVLRPLRKGGRQRIRYTASSTVAIRVLHVASTGPLLNAATAAGASGIRGPDFDFSDPSAGRAAAEKAAVEDARRRADAAAALLGQKVVGVQSLDLNPSSGRPVPATPPTPAAGVAPSTPAAPTPVSPGTEEFEATVNAVFLIAPQ